MLPLLTLLLVFALGVALISLVMLHFAGVVTRRWLTDPFTYAEYITEHKQPPPEWLRSQNPIDTIFRRSAFDTPQVTRMTDRQQQWMKTRLLRRLAHLIRYFETGTFFDSEEAHAQLLSELTQILETWKQCELHEILRMPPYQT